jgi:D-alanine-D-alanine ligase
MDRSNVRVAVVFGGRSSEHEVSLASAANVMDALDKAGYTVIPVGITPAGRWLTTGDPMRQLCDAAAMPPSVEAAMPGAGNSRDAWALLPSTADTPHLATVDLIFPVLHGPYGEDGTIQGMLEMANLPYVGSGVAGSAVAMDKVIAKGVFAAAGLPQVRHTVVTRSNWQNDPNAAVAAIEAALAYPLFVKPANLGSSVGVHKARSRTGLIPAIDDAAAYDRKVIVEEAVPHAREIEVSVLGNDDPIASVPGEIIPGREFYDYAAKYLEDSSQLLIPAPLATAQTEAVRHMAVQAFQAIDGSGLARVDFLVDGERGDIYLNEINTMPGFTRISMYPKLWEATGIPYPELVDRLVQLALERHTDRQQNRTTREV